MAALTNYTENNLINALFRTAAFIKPTTLYVGLITAVTNGETGSVTEVLATATGYARVARAVVDANWVDSTALNDGTTSNVAVIQFPAATADWGTVTHFGIWNAATAGDLLIYAPLNPSRTITNGTTPSFGANALTFQIDN